MKSKHRDLLMYIANMDWTDLAGLRFARDPLMPYTQRQDIVTIVTRKPRTSPIHAVSESEACQALRSSLSSLLCCRSLYFCNY